MVSDADIVSAIHRLRARVHSDIMIDRVILFGSRARGNARDDSDIDLIVVSPSFEGRSIGWRAYPLRRAWDLDAAVDFLCYTPEEFARLADRPTIVRLALTEGREIASA